MISGSNKHVVRPRQLDVVTPVVAPATDFVSPAEAVREDNLEVQAKYFPAYSGRCESVTIVQAYVGNDILTNKLTQSTLTIMSNITHLCTGKKSRES